ncbi:hypothetical protein D2V17_14165 [Aurantiacibacter xanthus]|uniref:Uncharacterized protein n=1 Tax=Aurantiacibacter xanthus TaxID=1784712 RepID=A0A3A1P1B6_9SPHN|nr:hypothetical protein [Aurantiacibacter xanthus]RIV82943.1 hypothetical protein D2V17_14165 [Aurantiacibacter xanthus]
MTYNPTDTIAATLAAFEARIATLEASTPVDETPDAFNFTDATGAGFSAQQTSNLITVAGLGTGVSVAVSVAGGTYSKNGGSYTSSAGTAQNGDTFRVRHTSSASYETAVNTTLTIGGVSDTFTSTTLADAGDVIAPTLSSPTDAANGTDAMTGSVSTNEGNGTLYWFISTSPTPPSAANLKAGVGAVAAGSQAVSATGTQNISNSGLSAETTYYTHFLHRDDAGNDSAIATSDGFTTEAEGVAPLSFPAQGARYDIDWTQSADGEILTYASAPIPSNPAVFPIQPDNNTSSNDGRFFRQLVSQSLPVYAENADGSLRRFASSTTLRTSSRGILVEPIVNNGEQPILWTNDLTNAAWIKTGITAVANETNRANRTNSATRLTATADGGTVLYPVTLAESTRNLYADIKRITGTGTVEMTLDGGANWTEITLNKPRYDGWGRYGLPLATVTDPSFGFRLGTSGDQIAVAFVTSDLSPYELSPWDMSGTARRRLYDRPSTSTEGGSTTPKSSGLMDFLASGASWGVYIEWDTQKPSGFLFGQIIKVNSDGVISASTDDGGKTLVTAADTNRLTVDPTAPLTNKAMMFVDTDTTGVRLCANGGPIYSRTGFGAYTTLDHKDLGSNGSGTTNIAGYIRRLVIFDTAPTDEQMQAWTAVLP